MYRFADLDPFAARRAKLEAWRSLGIDPYPAKTPEHDAIASAREHGNHLVAEGRLEQGTAVVGRIRSLRGQGAILFMDLEDATGKLQLLAKSDVLSAELFERLALLDLGDFIWAKGILFVTKRGELTLEVQDWQILSKSLHPLPDSWKGLQDIELRQRQRYVDLLVNEHTRERFKLRSALVAELRRFMSESGFMEVETPVLEHIPGGADAEPFVTHHEALDTDFYLRISLELHLKRLVVGGFDRVYEIGRVFRNEGISPQHLQEFTMFEYYWAYADYSQGMEFVEKMYRQLATTLGTTKIERGEHVVDFTPENPWPRTSYTDLLQQYAGVDILAVSDEELVEHLKRHGVETDISLGRGRMLDQLYKKTVRPHLIQPQFVVDFPLEFSPLAKKKADNPRLTERFVVVADGIEIGNAFSELNDPMDQKERFEEQEKLRIKGDPEAQRMDADFVRAMEYGMPPMTGFGVGIDRLVMLLTGVDSIRETVLFPTMRPEHLGAADADAGQTDAAPSEETKELPS